MQPDRVWFSWPLSAQESRQRCLLAPEPPHPQYHQAERQTGSHRWARRSGEGGFSNWVPVPVLQRLSGRGLRSDGPSTPERGGGSNRGVSTAMCDLTDYSSAPLLMRHKYSTPLHFVCEKESEHTRWRVESFRGREECHFFLELL